MLRAHRPGRSVRNRRRYRRADLVVVDAVYRSVAADQSQAWRVRDMQSDIGQRDHFLAYPDQVRRDAVAVAERVYANTSVSAHQRDGEPETRAEPGFRYGNGVEFAARSMES